MRLSFNGLTSTECALSQTLPILLVRYPEVANLVGPWAYNGPAILSAVEDARKVGQVKIVAFEEEDQTLAGVKAVAIYATIVRQPYEFGYQAIRMMAKVLDGDKSAIPASNRSSFPHWS